MSITVTGTIQRSDMGAGTAVVTDDGVTYEVHKGAPKELLKPGQKVKGQDSVRRCHDVCHDWSCPGS